jgi:DNA-binding transcriptional MerR regulator
MTTIEDSTLSEIERTHAEGLTSAELLDIFARHEVPMSEATLRKYVQMGLLPRSVRVGSKGKHRGSKCMYPVSVLRQVLHIKQMMAQDYTIEEIRRDFLFVRSDVQQLEQTFQELFKKLGVVAKRRGEAGVGDAVSREIRDARTLSKDLLARLMRIETHLSSTARLRAAVS